MNVKEFFTDDRAVSPVIGVILMVAITVILAAVIGTFVLGLGNNLQQTSPNSNFQFDYSAAGNNAYNVTAVHQGGATLTADNSGNVTLEADGTVQDYIEPNQYPFGAGDSLAAEDPSGAVDSSTEVRVIWISPNGGNSQTIAKGQTPS